MENMNEIYKEIFELRKRLQELENKVQKPKHKRCHVLISGATAEGLNKEMIVARNGNTGELMVMNYRPKSYHIKAFCLYEAEAIKDSIKIELVEEGYFN